MLYAKILIISLMSINLSFHLQLMGKCSSDCVKTNVMIAHAVTHFTYLITLCVGTRTFTIFWW